MPVLSFGICGFAALADLSQLADMIKRWLVSANDLNYQ